LLDTPVNGGGPNPLCATAERKTQASPENQRSVGALFTYGRFTFLDLGYLNWAKLRSIKQVATVPLTMRVRRRICTPSSPRWLW